MTAENQEYKLIFEGPSDSSPETLRQLKGVFLADLEFPVEEITRILQQAPLAIKTSDEKKNLEHAYQLLHHAGAKVLIVGPSGEPEEPGAAAEFTLDLTEMGFDTETLSPAGTQGGGDNGTKVYVLNESEDLDSILDEFEGVEKSTQADTIPAQSPDLETATEAPSESSVDASSPQVEPHSNQGLEFGLSLDAEKAQGTPSAEPMQQEKAATSQPETGPELALDPISGAGSTLAESSAPPVAAPETSETADDYSLFALKLEASRPPSGSYKAPDIQAQAEPAAPAAEAETPGIALELSLPETPKQASSAGVTPAESEKKETPPTPPANTKDELDFSLENLSAGLSLALQTPVEEHEPVVEHPDDPLAEEEANLNIPPSDPKGDGGSLLIAPENPPEREAEAKAEKPAEAPKPAPAPSKTSPSASAEIAPEVTASTPQIEPSPASVPPPAQVKPEATAVPPAAPAKTPAAATPPPPAEPPPAAQGSSEPPLIEMAPIREKKKLLPPIPGLDVGIAIVVGAIVLFIANYWYYSQPAEEETPAETEAAQVAARAKEKREKLTQKRAAEAQAAADNAGPHGSFSAKTDLSGGELAIELVRSGKTVEYVQFRASAARPANLSNDEIAANVPERVWLKKVESGEFQVTIDQNLLRAEAPARTYLEIGGKNERIVSSVLLTATLPDTEEPFTLHYRLAHGTDESGDTPTFMVDHAGSEDYKILVSGELTLNKVAEAAAPTAESNSGAETKPADNSAEKPSESENAAPSAQ